MTNPDAQPTFAANVAVTCTRMQFYLRIGSHVQPHFFKNVDLIRQ